MPSPRFFCLFIRPKKPNKPKKPCVSVCYTCRPLKCTTPMQHQNELHWRTIAQSQHTVDQQTTGAATGFTFPVGCSTVFAFDCLFSPWTWSDRSTPKLLPGWRSRPAICTESAPFDLSAARVSAGECWEIVDINAVSETIPSPYRKSQSTLGPCNRWVIAFPNWNRYDGATVFHPPPIKHARPQRFQTESTCGDCFGGQSADKALPASCLCVFVCIKCKVFEHDKCHHLF